MSEPYDMMLLQHEQQKECATVAKMTKKEALAGLRTMVEGLIEVSGDEKGMAPYLAFIDNESAILDRKANAKPNPKRDAAKEAVKQDIQKALLMSQKPLRVGEIHALGVGSSPQQVTALVGQLVKEGIAVRTVDKGNVYFDLKI